MTLVTCNEFYTWPLIIGVRTNRSETVSSNTVLIMVKHPGLYTPEVNNISMTIQSLLMMRTFEAVVFDTTRA